MNYEMERNIQNLDAPSAKRLTTYSTVTTELALLSDQRLSALLEEATHIVLFRTEKRNTIIHEYAKGIGNRTLGPVAESIITRYAPITAVMNEFYRKFLTEARTVSYPPAAELECLCAAADLQFAGTDYGSK